MRKFILFFYGSFLLFTTQAWSQQTASVSNSWKDEQQKVVQQIRGVSIDSSIVNPIARYFEAEINTIHKTIYADRKLPVLEKEKAVRSLVYFMTELRQQIAEYNATIYDIPGALQSYKSTLSSIVYNKPFAHLLTPLEARRTHLLAVAFTQYKEYSFFDDITVYKRVASTPEYILQFLENKPGFRYTDSLLLIAAAHDPLKLAFYLTREDRGLHSRIRNSTNIYLQQIASLAGDKGASELVPFLTPLAENRISSTEIQEKRADIIQYYQLLVNTLIDATTGKDSTSAFLKPLRNGIREKALAFFVNPVNDLHNSTDAVRFASVKDLRPEDLYYIIVSCGEELYTSSFLGLYKRLVGHYKEGSPDSIFTVVNNDHFRTFMRMAANYNVLTDFLKRMPDERRNEMMHQFIAGIEKDPATGLEKAMDIGDSFAGLDSSTQFIDLVERELKYNLNRSKTNQHFLGMRLYSILLQVFDLVKQGEGFKKLWSVLGNYEQLEWDALKNSKGEIDQLVLFYGDEDGISSFNNFMKTYNDSKKWKIIRTPNWVSIQAVSQSPVNIYANIPLNPKEELDLRAQDSLIAYLRNQGSVPTILVHRGHSYHLDKTLKRLSPSIRLAVLGSCGSYNKGISIASINPDVQVIGSRKTGAKSINDPIIETINENLLNSQDLYWPEIWKKLRTRFAKDESTLALFNEYFPPHESLSLFVLKLFNYYN